jgi:CTP synthase (UTP-ammonia lyase)
MDSMITSPPRLALVGDRSPDVRAHGRIPILVQASGQMGGAPAEPIELYWIASDDVARAEDLAGFDGIWVVPGSPYASAHGAVSAITAAREGGVPFLGTCGGFQYAVIEFARNVCGMVAAEHAEAAPEAADLLIVQLRCSLWGEEDTVWVEPDSLAASLMGAGASTERFFCAYGVDERRVGALQERGLVVSGHDRSGAPRIIELPGHPFFLGSLFQPELSSDATAVHPLLVGFFNAVRRHAAGPTDAAEELAAAAPA